MPDPRDIFAANVAALRRHDPELAARLSEQPEAEPALVWSESRIGGMPTATIEHDGRPLQLASRFDPRAEAAQLIEAFDPTRHAGVFVLGLGLGYHALALADRVGDDCVMVVYEPDAALLRAVLRTIDHTRWLGRPNVLVITGDAGGDRAALLARMDKASAILTQGTVLITHPPSRQRFAQRIADFGQAVADVLSFARTNVATTLVNASRTVRNQALNLAWYAAGATTEPLRGAAKGLPAVCVGAGPSLAKNVHLLADPAVRRGVVVISAQTTLKPLLDRGIEPDFVTALDYHEISRRFYEGLPPLPRVTLVAEPKAHPSILDSFPGPVRVAQCGFLDRLLGSDLFRPITPIKSGATVAHLSFYLAQHLGCDPIILIGQDLGFSDGLYYCPGTAIHDVWAPELGPFNTLEMMEWQRIVRHRHHLSKHEDVHGRTIYSDEQMVTYLKQFERDFADAAVARTTVIDATEGGLPKANATRMTLRDALARYASTPAAGLAATPLRFDVARLRLAINALRRREREFTELRHASVLTAPLLRQMLEHERDEARVARIYSKVEVQKKRVAELKEAFSLVNELNTIGAFRRARADRAIRSDADPGHDDRARRARQIERDIDNVEMIIQACDETLAIVREAAQRLEENEEKAEKHKGTKSQNQPAEASASL